MAWTRQELVDWVQARIDEISDTDQTASIPQLMIERELDESAVQVIHKAKKQLIYPAGKSLAANYCLVKTVDDVPASVIVPLKPTFLRFLRVRLQNWKMPIDELVSVDANTYRHQYNRFQAATKGRPTAALIPFHFEEYTGIYNQAIELFPPPTGDELTRYTEHESDAPETGSITQAAENLGEGMFAVFNSVPGTALLKELIVVEKTPAEGMPDSLIDPIVWLAAGRCLTNLRLTDLAKTAYDTYSFVMNDLNVGMKGEGISTNKGQ